MDPIQQAVQQLYRSDPEREWQRMARHRTEFAVTLRALAEHLPPPPARVLDCGGGPGRYAIALAERGYEVVLFDLSPDLLAMAREKATEAGVTPAGFELGTATDLGRFPEASFDAVLLMGPLYHLLEEAQRQRALAEAYRVLKPGGPVFAAFITRYAAHRYAAAHFPEEPLSEEERASYRSILETGISPPSEGTENTNFVAYMAHPTEVAPLCRQVGFEVRAVLGVEGLVSMQEALVNALEGEAWDFWVNLNYRVASDPNIHGLVEHLLAVARKPYWRAVLHRIALAMNHADIAYRVVGGTALALRGLQVPVNDIDVEMLLPEDAYRFEGLFPGHVMTSVAHRVTEDVRSHFGRFDFDGVIVEIMAGLERRMGDRWLPSFLETEATVDLDGVPVHVLHLEEEVLAYLRRSRLDRAALALPSCDPDALLMLLREAFKDGRL
jgi:ubiquinone/menaquinone biosynthesis C-methylase UbiE